MKLKHRLRLVLLIACLSLTGWCRAQISVGSEPGEENPWFSYYVIEKASQQSATLKSKMLLSEADAVKKIDTSLAFAYPKMAVLRPKGIIASEPDKRYAMIYRKMAWYAANDQIVSAQILFYTAVRLKLAQQASGKEMDLAYLTLHQFIYNAICVDFSESGEHEHEACRRVQTIAQRAQTELKSQRLRQYLNWVALGLSFDDVIAYQAGVSLLDQEQPSRSEKDAIKSMLKPLLKKNAG